MNGQERLNGRCQENPMAGSLDLDEQMFGMQARLMRIKGLYEKTFISN